MKKIKYRNGKENFEMPASTYEKLQPDVQISIINRCRNSNLIFKYWNLLKRLFIVINFIA